MSGSSLLSLFVNSFCEQLRFSLSHHSFLRGRPALHRSVPWLFFPPADSPFFPTNFSFSLPQRKAPFSTLTPYTAASSFLQLLIALIKLGLPCKCPGRRFHVALPFHDSWILTLSFFPLFPPQGHLEKRRHSCGCCHRWIDLHLGDEPSEFRPGWWGHIYHL